MKTIILLIILRLVYVIRTLVYVIKNTSVCDKNTSACDKNTGAIVGHLPIEISRPTTFLLDRSSDICYIDINELLCFTKAGWKFPVVLKYF